MVTPTQLLGQRFGRLLVVERVDNDRFGKARWRCRCDCGRETTTRANTLRKGETQSCGCLHAETVKTARLTHGAARSPLYRVWSTMKSRCETPTDQRYPWYGARGIAVCTRWRERFTAFAHDMGVRPPGMKLERRDNDGDYTPENCYWATSTQQMRNTRRTWRLVHNGVARTLGEWAEVTGLPETLLYYRIKTAGWPPSKALTKPSQRKKPK